MFNHTIANGSPWKSWLIALLILSFVEWITFGSTISRVGFYLDDWSVLESLFFGPQSFLPSLFHFFLNDPRVIIRPIEAPHFAILYALFGLKPFGYHLVNIVFEVLAAFIFYLIIKEYIEDQVIALVSAIFLLLYPAHDSSHYWMLCSSVTLSLLLYLISLWTMLRGVKTENYRYYLVSWLSYFLSLFNYECLLPLFVINVIWALILKRPAKTIDLLKKCILLSLPYVLIIASTWFYQKQVVPNIGKGIMHAVEFNLLTILQIIEHGVAINMPIHAFAFFSQQASQFISSKLPISSYYCFIFFNIIIICVLWFLNNGTKQKPRQHADLSLIALGVIALPVSFSIFGLNHEYDPTLNSILNRVNMGATFALSLIFAGCIQLIKNGVVKFNLSNKFYLVIATIVICPLFSFFILTDWSMARPWIVSWQMQKQMMSIVSKNQNVVQKDDVILLAHYPRYFYWSPVFDGIWDFQAMLRISYKNQSLNAGVVSDRMKLSNKAASDISLGTTCGSYPFDHMLMILDSASPWQRIHSASEFISAVQAKQGLCPSVDQATIDRWQREIRH